MRSDPQAPGARRVTPVPQVLRVLLSLALAETQARSVVPARRVRLVLQGPKGRASRVPRVPQVLVAPPASRALPET